MIAQTFGGFKRKKNQNAYVILERYKKFVETLRVVPPYKFPLISSSSETIKKEISVL